MIATPDLEKNIRMKNEFTYDEVKEASLKYFNGDELAAEVFAGKYALRNLEGNTLYEKTPEDMHHRLAKEFARIEKKYPDPMSEKEIFDLLSNWEVIPQGSPMSGIGNTGQLQSLSNCFVIDGPYDSYGGICKVDEEQAQIMKRRGGVGFDISRIRPEGMPTTNAARTTTGIAGFMERFSNTCREVGQGGRRGALLLTINVHHPQIRTFINIKRDLEKVTGANISIRLTDEFMNAVKNEIDVELRFPVEPDLDSYDIQEKVSAKELWDEIIESAHESGEPGLLFWDTVHRRGPADAYEEYKSTACNPCGEITLAPGGSCRLLIVNLTKFINNPFKTNSKFDYKRFEEVSYKAQRLMDDLVDLELERVQMIIDKVKNDPENEEIKTRELKLWERILETGKKGRRTGLGITGLGDATAMLGQTYGSDESVTTTHDIYRSLALASYRSSVDMAEQRGAFPAFDKKIEENHEFIKQIMGEDEELARKYMHFGRRNIANTTTAPAGSVSILAQCTSGCEPVFMLTYKRRKKINPNDNNARVDFEDKLGDKWQMFDVFHHGLLKWAEVNGCEIPDVSTEEGLKEFEQFVKKSPYFKSTSTEIDWVKKIDMQANAQKWICHSISNTTNLPKNATVEDVKAVYMRGWETGCKGVTVYRDESRDGVLVAKNDENKNIWDLTESGIHAPKRPKELGCDIHRATVKGEQYMVIVGLLEDRPYELFCGLSEHITIPRKTKKGTLIKSGKKNGITTYNLRIPVGDDDEILLNDIVEQFDNPTYGSLTRSLSLSLRHGIPVHHIVEQLRKDKHSDIFSFSTVVARILSKHYIQDGTPTNSEKKCPECGGTNLAYQSGCVSCIDCAWTRCQ